MSEQETPKRVRKPKVEGEVPAKRVKKTVKTEAVEETKAAESYSPIVSTKTPEQGVLILACLNPIVADAAIQAARKESVEVVFLEDRVIRDFLDTKNNKNVENRNIGEFLNNTSNRLHAENQCVKLWMILTGGKPIEDADNVVFTRTEVVKKTNLSHNQAGQIFQLLRAFGMLEFVNGSHEFKLHFNKSRCHKTIKTEIMSVVNSLGKDILRYKASVDSDDKVSEEDKKKIYEAFQKEIYEQLKF